MFKLVKQFKREFVYSSYLFLVLELLVTRQFVYNIYTFAATSIVGMAIILSWMVSTFQLFSKRKVSAKSIVYSKVNIWKRAFSYILLPVVLWVATSIFLLFSENTYINQLIIVTVVSMYFSLMLQIRGSFEKIYSVSVKTRYVYDLINLVVFYMLTSVLQRIGLDILLASAVVTIFALLAFSHTLYSHRKLEGNTVLVAVIASLAVGSVHYLLRNTNIYILPGIISIIYYLILSLWNARFSGARKLEDFVPPLMYALMALILVLSL